ncbi:LysR family transcriptional regulator [Pseudomonas uvaldensis]|uniref:LysR family transcriptional regulator n=1 Tax=Pseudomonas uvaldensis TaxID=2878385 RepID=UPI001E5FA3FC|nr:LysR family transcriptional regulator [Pseudomonas uvaldensis]MCE0461353.1 LysR family transcriptional regulator [Pseudomonas uvaldensis]
MASQANWDDLRLLLAVSRRGSFLQAGQLLGIAASTVSRRLTQLEAALGEPLVERGVEGCWLTSRGQSLVDVALAAEAGLRRQTFASLPGRQAELSGSVLVSAGEGFSSSVLEAASRFTALHPRCSVELQLSAEFHKIVRGVADVAVRTAHLGEPSLIYKSIGRVAYGVFAQASYLERLPGLTPATAPPIGLLPPLDMLPQMRAAKAAGLARAQISVNSFTAQLEAVRRGLGVGVLPRILARDLVEVFAQLPIPDLEVYLVSRPQALKQAHIKCFFGILEQVLLESVSEGND